MRVKLSQLILLIGVVFLGAEPSVLLGQTKNLATKEDVGKIGRKITSDLKRTIELERKKEAEKSAAEQKKIVEETKAALENAQKKLRYELAVREMQDKAEREAYQRTTRYITFTGFVVLLVLLTVLTVFIVRKREHDSRVMEEIDKALDAEKCKQLILVDPDIGALREFSRKNNGITKIPFVLTLKNGKRYNCIAELRENLDPLVYFEKVDTPVAWDKRRRRAATLSVLDG